MGLTSLQWMKCSRFVGRVFLHNKLHIRTHGTQIRTGHWSGLRCCANRRPNLIKVNTCCHQSAGFSSKPSGSDSEGSDINLNSARRVLQQYPGGSVDLERDSATGIAVITLNHPEKKNALSGKMMMELTDVVSELELWEEGKGLILRGAGQFFCSGAELEMVKHSMENKEWSQMMATHMQHVTTRILSLPMVSVALIEGGALGGGAEMATCCDFRIATEDSKMSFLQVKLGVVTGFGAGTRLVQILGRTKALDLMCSSRSLTATEAEQFGLLNEVIPSGTSQETLENGKQWLSRFTRWDAMPVRAAKTIIHSASTLSAEKSLHIEKTMFSKVWGNPVHRKAIGLESSD